MSETISRIPWPPSRIVNDVWSGERERCLTCEDEGIVEVGLSTVGTVVMAPCPYCRKGFQLEFAYGRQTDRNGRKLWFRGWSPWGAAGFWNDRQTYPKPEQVRRRGAEEVEMPADMRPDRMLELDFGT